MPDRRTDLALCRMVEEACARVPGLAPDQRDELASAARARALRRLREGWLDGRTQASRAGRLATLAQQSVRMCRDYVQDGRRQRMDLEDPRAPGALWRQVDPGPSPEAMATTREQVRQGRALAVAAVGYERAYRMAAFESPALVPVWFPDDTRNAVVARSPDQTTLAGVFAPGAEPRRAANSLARAARRDVQRLAGG